jgi:hypothetical protein
MGESRSSRMGDILRRRLEDGPVSTYELDRRVGSPHGDMSESGSESGASPLAGKKAGKRREKGKGKGEGKLKGLAKGREKGKPDGGSRGV